MYGELGSNLNLKLKFQLELRTRNLIVLILMKEGRKIGVSSRGFTPAPRTRNSNELNPHMTQSPRESDLWEARALSIDERVLYPLLVGMGHLSGNLQQRKNRQKRKSKKENTE